jgi:hypothetical protein
MSEFSRTVLAVGAAGPFAGFVPPALARRGKESQRLCMTQHRPILYDNEAPLKLLSETCVTETGKNRGLTGIPFLFNGLLL